MTKLRIAGTAVGTVAIALLAAPGALAAPANDNFASAEPITNPESDLRDDQATDLATMEAGEPTTVDGVTVSHSIWYSWTAPYTGSGHVRGCRNNPSNLSPMVAVYTGSAVNALTPVGTSQTPVSTCADASFNVTAGTTYHAAVYATNNTPGSAVVFFDHDNTSIAAPANNSFANALPLTGSPISVAGTNRGATAEAGEPLHFESSSPNPLGSVWYAWRATGTGPVTVDICDPNFDTVLDVYIGAGLAQLNRIVAGDDDPCPTGDGSLASFNPQCGLTYYFSVDGHAQLVFPERGDFDLQITQAADGGICPTIGDGGDTIAPDTQITKHPKKKTTKRRAKFAFTSTEGGSSFTCALDGKTFGCTSPFTKKVKPGKHRFKVAAIDAAGNKDGTVAAFRWKVLRTS